MPRRRCPTTEKIAVQALATVDRAIQRHIPGLKLPEDLIGELGATPKDVIHARGALKLYRCRALHPPSGRLRVGFSSHLRARGHYRGRPMYNVLAEEQIQVLGYSSLYRNDFDWSRHAAELRVLIAPQVRHLGLGRLLTRKAFSVALTLGIEKIIARMTPDQTGARTVFEELGFRPEALLRDKGKDQAGKPMIFCSWPMTSQPYLARGEAYGIPR